MNHLFSFRTWSGRGLVRVEGWRGLVAHEGLKGSFFLFPFFFFYFTGGHLDVRSAPYSRWILKRYSTAYVHPSVRCIPTFNHRHHRGTYWHLIINIRNMASVRTSELITTRGHTLQCELEGSFSALVFNLRQHLQISVYFKSCFVI